MAFRAARLDGHRVLIGDAREAESVDLPTASRGAVGRQELRFSLGCRMAVDDVVLGVGRGGEHVQSRLRRRLEPEISP